MSTKELLFATKGNYLCIILVTYFLWNGIDLIDKLNGIASI